MTSRQHAATTRDLSTYTSSSHVEAGRHAIDDDHGVRHLHLRKCGPQANAALEDAPDAWEDAILEGTDRLLVDFTVAGVEIAIAGGSQHPVPDEKGSRETYQDRTDDDLDQLRQYDT